MKKYIFLLFSVLAFALTACNEETEPGGTAVEKMAGEWVVKSEGVNDGEWFTVRTYNTASNVATEMWLEDKGLNYKIKVSVSYDARTFMTVEAVTNTIASKEDAPAPTKIKISEGKVQEGVYETPGGHISDKISFTVEANGQTYKVEGFRRTGFEEDNVI